MQSNYNSVFPTVSKKENILKSNTTGLKQEVKGRAVQSYEFDALSMCGAIQ